METSVTKKGQTNIPAAIRKRHHIHEGDRLLWLDDGEVIRILPVPKDPLKALRAWDKEKGSWTVCFIAVERIVRVKPKTSQRVIGQDDGLFEIPDNFDAPLPDEVLALFQSFWPQQTPSTASTKSRSSRPRRGIS